MGEPQRGLLAGLGRAAVVAHGAGNSPETARQAIAVGADLLEVDLWLHGGRLEARHERALYPLPVLFERWYLRFAPRRPFDLSLLLRESAGNTPVLLDLKNGPGEVTARLVREAFDESPPGEMVFASSQQWHVLRALQTAVPEAALLYSIDVPAKLDLFLSVSKREQLAHGVSCHERLLNEALICDLKGRGLFVVAWTVDDPDRAAQLIGWGVDAITTHRIAETRTLAESLR